MANLVTATATTVTAGANCTDCKFVLSGLWGYIIMRIDFAYNPVNLTLSYYEKAAWIVILSKNLQIFFI